MAGLIAVHMWSDFCLHVSYACVKACLSASSCTQVDADGSFRLTGDQQKDTKGNTYKASYHSSRAPLFLQRWVK